MDTRIVKNSRKTRERHQLSNTLLGCRQVRTTAIDIVYKVEIFCKWFMQSHSLHLHGKRLY